MAHVESTKPGCLWIVATHADRLGIKTDEYCKKICAEDSAYCSKHRLIDEQREAEVERRMERARKGKEKKRLFRESLKVSPLRAINPKFPKEKLRIVHLTKGTCYASGGGVR